MLNKAIILTQDGHNPHYLNRYTDQQLIHNFNLTNAQSGYNCQTLQNNKINFVGLLMNNNHILFSLPKHYPTKCITSQDIKLILKGIMKTNSIATSVNNSIGNQYTNQHSYPLYLFLRIYNYWTQYGLYKHAYTSYQSQGYTNHIDWNRTVQQTTPYIINHSLMYLNPISRTKVNRYNQVSECMDYIIQYTLKRFNWLLQLPYWPLKHYQIKFQAYKKYIIPTLQQQLDSEPNLTKQQLISDLIKFFESVTDINEIRLDTYRFDIVWELAVNKYLSKHVDAYKVAQAQHNKHILKPMYAKLPTKQVCFSHHLTFPIGIERLHRNSKKTSQLNLVPDHCAKDNKNKIYYLFDSKYYNDLPQDNYKQMIYHIIFQQKVGTKHYKLLDSLVLPSSKIKAHAVPIVKCKKPYAFIIWATFLNCKKVFKDYTK